jgi:dihydroorotate dehydrogenase
VFLDNYDIARLFGPVWGASGVQGFFGEGYRFHRYLGPAKPDFDGMTFVAKTTTLKYRKGNTPLNEDYEPIELFPESVHVGISGFLGGYALNAWGLSGPGLQKLLATGRWQHRTAPFMISFMTLADSPEEQLAEVVEFSDALRRENVTFAAEVGVQLNVSCPNTDTDTDKLIKEATRFLDVMAVMKRPVIVKVSADMNPMAVAEIAAHNVCNALCVSNTVKFGKLPDKINWEKLYGKTSPLAEKGGGGLSGAPLLPLTVEFVTRLHALGVSKHINAGGGILRPRDAGTMADAGANSIFIGSMAMLRPWWVQQTIRRAHQLFKA